MPDFTITLSAQTVALIQARTALFNEANGTSLTPKQWVRLQLFEAVYGDDMETEARNLEAAYQAAVKAKRDQLLGAL